MGNNQILIAARVSTSDTCPICETLMLYDDGRDSYVCNCGFATKNRSSSVDIEKIASSISIPVGNLNCSVSISLSANFEGSISNQALSRKLKSELISAIESSIQITAREFDLKVSGVQIKQPSIDVIFIPKNDF